MSEAARILEAVRTVAKQQVNPDPEESLFESGVLDSFALTDLVSALETEFGITVPDSDLNPRKFESLAKIEAYIENHK
ncbi:MAG: phosphopantetheine-binding protein [Bryobacteraceae bacterium]